MRRNELDFVLSSMLDSQQEVSDLNFTVDKPLQVESFGELLPVTIDPPLALERLTPFQTEMVAMNLMGGSRRLIEDLLRSGSCDSSYSVGDQVRFRVNIFSQRGHYSIVLRKLNTKIPTLEELGMPDIFHQLAKEKTGLILVTGATGSGKTTTLAAVLNEVNDTRPVHVITLEDPVEFIHPQKLATFNQRELGMDFNSFASGLRAALRQAPKVILVGEMRDRETVEIGLTAAETGHLVLATLHTIDAGQTINRIVGMFDPEEQEQVRVRLADTLRWVVSERLAPREGGGRTALLEIMGNNLRTKESVQLGESEGKTFYEIIEASYTFGWRTFDHACLESYEQGLISEETAMLYCTKRGLVARGIDNIKKKRGQATSDMSDLRMRSAEEIKKAGAPPLPATLKLK
jgi:twitching motility protein PilT